MSEQLQNERTTVSRAVAQNQELKSQLIELQDRFVQLTNDCAEKEDERITSLATIERLRHQIEDIVSSKNRVNQARIPIKSVRWPSWTRRNTFPKN